MARYGCTLTVNAGQIPSNQTDFVWFATVTNFPTEAIDGGATSILNGGGNLRCYTDSTKTTQLPIEVVRFVTGVSPDVLIWGLSPALGVGDTVYVEADTVAVSQPPVTDTYGRNSVWVDYDLVCHFEEGAAGNYVDSSGNQTDGTITLGSITTQQGILGTEIIFNGGATVEWAVNSSLQSQPDLFLSVVCSPADNLANQLCGNFNGDAGSNTNDVRVDAAGAESGNPRFTTTHQVGANSSAQIGAGWSNGDDIWYAYKYEGAVESNIIMDGTVRTTTPQTGSMGGGTANFILGSKSGSTDRYVGSVAHLRMSNQLPPNGTLAGEYNNQFAPSSFWSTSAWEDQDTGGETLTADPGTYALIGATVELTAQRSLTADAGSYALTGADVDILAQRSLTADAGSYALTGADVDILAQRSLTADAGSYALTGADVNLFANRVIVAEKGEYTLTGSAVRLIYSDDTTQVVTKITATFKAVDITPSYAQAWSVNFKDQ